MAKAKPKQLAVGPSQIAVMKNLNQQAAGWLLGLDGRALRDKHDLPRKPTGRYNARDLLEWATGRLPEPDFSETEHEKLLTIRDHYLEEVCLAVGPIFDFLDGLQEKYGDAGLAMFARQLMDHCRAIAKFGNPYEEPTAAEVRADMLQRLEADKQRRAIGRLELAVVCDVCKKLRHGPRWIKRKPPEGFAVIEDTCPACKGE